MGAAALVRFLKSMLFGIAPLDGLTLGSVTLLLLAITVAAAWIPARRAARIDPMVALREE
jgi:ABC-type antimicrobial peptide transport system permease subunit